MKKALVVFGWVFLVLLLLGASMFGAAYWIAGAAEPEGKAYVDRVTPAIVGAWSVETLVAEASPALLEVAPRAKIDPLMGAFASPVVTMTYTADAAFEKGPATLRIRALRRAGQ
jgi:hypothetical protein